jgi:hypothetical protein
LVELGVLDVLPVKKGETQTFATTPIVPEYAQDYREYQREKYLVELYRQLESGLKLLDASDREFDRLLAQARKENQRREMLMRKVVELSAEIKALEADS